VELPNSSSPAKFGGISSGPIVWGHMAQSDGALWHQTSGELAIIYNGKFNFK